MGRGRKKKKGEKGGGGGGDKNKKVLRAGLTSVHCPLVWTMSMTQGSDLFSVSRSSRALHETRSSTLETQAAGPLRLVAGEVASCISFILAQLWGWGRPIEEG